MTASSVYPVSCVGKKRQIPTAARDLYISPWFLKARAYVEKQCAPWFILSAAHGLLDPKETVGPYDWTMNDYSLLGRQQWAREVVALLDRRALCPDRYVILAGVPYRQFLIEPLEQRGSAVDVPLQGLSIGQQLAWLNHH